MDTLAVRLTVPPVGSVEDFHLQVIDYTPHVTDWRLHTTRPAGRTNKRRGFDSRGLYQSGDNIVFKVVLWLK